MLNPLNTEADWHELRRTAERLIDQATAAAESQSILLRELVGLDECLRLKNGSKNCCKTDFSGAAEAVSDGGDNSSGRTRTCDPGLMKLSGGLIETPALATENTVSPTPAELNLTLSPQTLTDEIQTPTDKLLQLEQLSERVVDAVPNVRREFSGFIYRDDLRAVVPLRDDQGRQLIHVPCNGHEGLPMTLALGGVRYEYVRSIVTGPTTTICQYREITSEEESHLEENRVDSGHDGILA